MDVVLFLTGVIIVPIAVGWLLAGWTSLPRLVVALVAGIPLPLIALVIALADYVDSLNIPAGRCGFSCELGRSLAPLVAMIAAGSMVIAVTIGFVTAMIVRRRHRRTS